MDYYQRSSKGLNTVPKRWIILGVGSIVTLWLLWFGVFSGPSLQAGRPLDIDSLQGVSDQAVAAILRLPTTFSLFRAPGDLRGQRKGSTSSHLSSLVDLSQKLSTFPRPKCAIRPWHNNRYAHLPRSNSTVFLALNLINAEIVMPTFLHELPAVLDFLGPNRVHVSIVENGSTDKTPTYLHLLSRALDTLGTSYSIIAKGDSEHFAKENGHRISVLAAVRNAAMAPLYDGKVAKKMLGERFNTVLFINDMVYCAVDVLEVLMQHSEQGADMACAVDWKDGVVYDRWVTRAMSGRPLYNYKDMVNYYDGPGEWGKRPLPPLLPQDPIDHTRFMGLLPLQVFSCWNGITAISASAFLPPHSIRFREAKNDPGKEATEKASECFLLPVDLWKAGMGKILVAPRASVAYDLPNYEKVRKDQGVGSVGAPSAARFPRQELIAWKRDPPAQIGYQDYANWYSPERWGPWDEA